MENLSSEELSLLLAIKRRPNMRLAMYGNSLRIAYIKALHTRNDLLHKNLILENSEGLMRLNEKAIEEHNIKLILANGEQPDPEPEVVAVETDTVQKFEDVDNKVLEMLKASPLGRTAKELAAPFGTKGTTLSWTLRNLIKQQKVVKRDLKYFIAEECDKVVSIPVVVDERRAVRTDLEIRSFILQQDGTHTQDSLYEHMSKLFIIDKNKFCEIFSDLVLDGYYNVHDGVEYVQHDLDFSPNNQHKRCANISSAEGITTTLNDFVSAWETFDLSTAVRETDLRHDRITKHLAAQGWDVSNQNKIFKPKAPVVGFAKFEDIDVSSARQLIFGIVKIDVFIKRFNLDPASKDEVIKMLELVKLAKYDEASGYLGPVKPTPMKAEPVVVEEPQIETSGTVKLDTNFVEVVGSEVHVKDENGETQHKIPLSDLRGVSSTSDEITILPKEEPFEATPDNSDSAESHNGGRKFTSCVPKYNLAPVSSELPTHITNRKSPLYGHPVLGQNGEQLNVSTTPDLEWIAAQTDTSIEEKLQFAKCPEHAAEILQHLGAYPTSSPTHEENPDSLKLTLDWESMLPINLKGGPCGRMEPDDSGLRGPAEGKHADKKKVPESEVKVVNPQWALTLQMLAERFQHEHQYTTANILREIHDYLVPK